MSQGLKPPSRRLPAEVLAEGEVLALIGACSSSSATGIRNRALIAVLWRCGLRISEALALAPRDVDLDAGTLRVRHGKGDRSRVLGLDATSAALLARWLDRRAQLDRERHSRSLRPASVPIFCTLAGGQLDTSYVRQLLPRLGERASLGRRVHAHGLRHTYAAELVREGQAIDVVRDALGHSSLAVTDRYLRSVAPARVIQATREREWQAPS